MTKDEKKAQNHRVLVDDIKEYIGDWEMSNHHYCTDEDVYKTFSHKKPKKVKKALKEIR